MATKRTGKYQRIPSADGLDASSSSVAAINVNGPFSSSTQPLQQINTAPLNTNTTNVAAAPGANPITIPGRSAKSDQLARLPKRTTKTSQKLTLFPEGFPAAEVTDNDALITNDEAAPQLPHVARKTQEEQFQLLSKLDRKWLPR
ncbi:hypothetical protein HK102_008341, partial [Quaeritorhiza haematococci]